MCSISKNGDSETGGILFIEPKGHRAGHYSSFTRILAKGFASKREKIIIITYAGLSKTNYNSITSLSHLPKFIGKILVRYSTRINMPLNIFENLLTFIIGLKVVYKKRNYNPFILDGEFLFIALFTLLTPSKRVYVFLHSANALPRFDIHNLSIKGKLWSQLTWFLLYKVIKKDKIALITTPEVVKRKPPILQFKRIKLVDWGIENLTVNDKEKNKSEVKRSSFQDYILLFGPNHSGKDYSVVFKSWNYSSVKPKILVAGKNVCNSNDPFILGKKMNENNKLQIIDRYFDEKEIPGIFSNARGVILSYAKDFASTCSIINLAVIFGIPVIASNSSGISQLVEEKGLGFTFSVSHERSLASKIDKLYTLDIKEKSALLANINSYRTNLLKEKNWNQTIQSIFDFISEDLKSDKT